VDGDHPFVALGWFEFVENQGIHDRTSFISGQSYLMEFIFKRFWI
jgi:hypothetical protein